MVRRLFCMIIFSSLTGVAGALTAEAAENAIQGAGGTIQFEVPEGWTVKQPKVRIIENELSIPAVEGDDRPGRMTMMSAGGSIKANLDRWKGQFKTTAEPRQEKLKIHGHNVHLLDLRGTYMDRRGPFGPAQPREDYRMLGIVMELEGRGLYFIKMYGPVTTIDKNEDKLRVMLNNMKNL